MEEKADRNQAVRIRCEASAHQWCYTVGEPNVDRPLQEAAFQLMRQFLPHADMYEREKFCKAFSEGIPFAWSMYREQMKVAPEHLRNIGAQWHTKEDALRAYETAIRLTLMAVDRQKNHYLTFLPAVSRIGSPGDW